MPLGSKVRKFRELAGWTLAELSDRSGVDIGTISALERRDSKRSEFASALAAAFGLTVEQLLMEDAAAPVTGTGSGIREPTRSEAEQSAARNVYWPFHRVSFQRLQELKRRLGKRAGEDAMLDIDHQIEIVVEKWERRAQEKQHAAA